MKNCKYFDLVSDPSANWICTMCICSLPSHLPDMNDDSHGSSSTSHDPDDPEIRLMRGFKVGHLNVNRLFNKLDSVKELIDKYSFDILALSETWLTSEICDNEISIKGYSVVRKDRQDSSKVCGGGVLIYVRDGIPFIRQTDFVDDNFECLWIQINRRFCKPMAVSVVYRPGYFNIEDFTNALTRILDNTALDKVEIIILDDFNVDYSAKKNPLRCRLDEFAFSFNLTQIISKPTRVTETSKSTIDLLLVNNTHN